MLGAQPRQGVGMCSYTSRAAALVLLMGALACSDRPPGTAPDAAGGPNVLSTATTPELLARSLARSEERRVGKECRSRWAAQHGNKDRRLERQWLPCLFKGT